MNCDSWYPCFWPSLPGAILISACASLAAEPAVQPIDPPEREFYAKRLDYESIPIKAPKEVADEALWAARDRLSMMLSNLPFVVVNLRRAGTELDACGILSPPNNSASKANISGGWIFPEG